METLANTFIIPAGQNLFFPENVLKNSLTRWIGIAMNTNSTFTGSYTENSIWYQKFDSKQNRILRGGQPVFHFDAAHNCCLYVTTMKAMNFQDDIPSVLIDSFKGHIVLVFDLTAMQDVTENFPYLELVGEPLRLELNFTSLLELVTELTVLGEGLSSVAVGKLDVVGNGQCFCPTNNQSYPTTQVSVPWFIYM